MLSVIREHSSSFTNDALATPILGFQVGAARERNYHAIFILSVLWTRPYRSPRKRNLFSWKIVLVCLSHSLFLISSLKKYNMRTRADEDATEALVVAPCNPYLLEQRCVGPLRETAEASTHIIFTLNDAFPIQIQMTRSGLVLYRLLLVRTEYVLHCINYIWILILWEVAHRIPLVSFTTCCRQSNQIVWIG